MNVIVVFHLLRSNPHSNGDIFYSLFNTFLYPTQWSKFIISHLFKLENYLFSSKVTPGSGILIMLLDDLLEMPTKFQS
jgi:hypothetical protein